ncbi:DNA repair protein RadC [Erysipelotrichaceae bacterium RD49]|nr:DNA repair protein RadC [Erysipelotrichaceae bacterium RD49]
MRIKDYRPEDRPREKALCFGLSSLSDQELICLLIGSGTKTKNALQIAQGVLEASDNLRKLASMTFSELMAIAGIGKVRALLIQAALELAARCHQANAFSQPVTLSNTNEVIEWFKAKYGDEKQEHFAALYLDTKGRILRHSLLSLGTLNRSLIHPRDVFRQAFETNAASVIFVHNHPSNDPSPSQEDLEATRILIDAADIFQIAILDHIIVGRDAAYSFRAHQLLD